MLCSQQQKQIIARIIATINAAKNVIGNKKVQ